MSSESLPEAIRKSPYNQGEVARILDLSTPYTNQILNGKRSMDAWVAYQISLLLGDEWPCEKVIRAHREASGK